MFASFERSQDLGTARRMGASLAVASLGVFIERLVYLSHRLRAGNLPPVEAARRELERKSEEVAADVRRGMGVLASVGSIAPFVGLLGTVVGIIDAFQGIAKEGSGGLGAVSGGIAEALVVTALGLVVAIPAVLAFNFLTSQSESLLRAVDQARSELVDWLENRHVETEGHVGQA
jgi:biopolymer transport protein ExbB